MDYTTPLLYWNWRITLVGTIPFGENGNDLTLAELSKLFTLRTTNVAPTKI